MSTSVWRIATDAPEFQAHELNGKGAERSGGRWNRAGRPLVYAAGTIALACLETVVHRNGRGLPLNRYLVRVDVPSAVWGRRTVLGADDLPVGWDAVPAGMVSLDIGDAWLRSGVSALLQIPSVVVPEESNLLLNPRHPDAAAVRADKLRRWTYDGRLN